MKKVEKGALALCHIYDGTDPDMNLQMKYFRNQLECWDDAIVEAENKQKLYKCAETAIDFAIAAYAKEWGEKPERETSYAKRGLWIGVIVGKEVLSSLSIVTMDKYYKIGGEE